MNHHRIVHRRPGIYTPVDLAIERMCPARGKVRIRRTGEEQPLTRDPGLIVGSREHKEAARMLCVFSVQQNWAHAVIELETMYAD
jgi:hypothetical protein